MVLEQPITVSLLKYYTLKIFNGLAITDFLFNHIYQGKSKEKYCVFTSEKKHIKECKGSVDWHVVGEQGLKPRNGVLLEHILGC